MTSKQFTQDNKDRLVEELISFLKLKSVSADPAFDTEVFKTAEFVEKSLNDAGISNTEICKLLAIQLFMENL